MIAHINTSKTWRGGEQQLFYLAMGLKELNHKQIVICQKNSELESRCKQYDIPYYPIRMRGEWDIFAARNISKSPFIKDIQIIHAHTAGAHSIGLLTKFFCPNIKLVVSRRVDFPINKNFLSKRKYFSPKNNIFLCVSNKVKEVLLKDGLPLEKVVTVHSGIDTTKFENTLNGDYIKKEFSISDDTVVIGNVAALVDHKDQKTLLKAISKIKTDKRYIFLIVGSGELELELKKLSNELQITDKVIFTGYRKDILEVYKILDIFTLTSKEEGLGTSVLDAMASKLPLVVTNGGGITEMVEQNKGGLIANIGDFETLSVYYKKLIEDKDLRLKMGNYNSEIVPQFSVKETVRKTIEIYNQLRNQHG